MTEPARELVNGVKIVGELVLPGASLWVQGNIVNGAIHTALGLGAKALLGPAGLVVVAADSYSKSTTGKYLWDHLVTAVRPAKPKASDELEAAPAPLPPSAPEPVPAAA